ncbi:MAG: MmgE/PrpD family protein [Burkholderiaceae bacterium]
MQAHPDAGLKQQALEPFAHEIARWAHRLKYSDAPAQVREALHSCLLYNLTMALAVDPKDDRLGKVLGAVSNAPGSAQVFNSEQTRSAEDAAFINAGLITARGQNDTHPQVVTHIGCIVIPAVFALADSYGASVDDVLDAILVGYEAVPRIARGLSDESSRRGFRGTPLYGVLGAALACSRVLKLSEDQTKNALSIATHYASGLMQTWIDGSDEWRLQVAKTSRDAVTAALLASAGMQGSAKCLDGQAGFMQAFGGQCVGFDPAGWNILDMTFKAYPGCAFNQAPVHALRQLLDRSAMNPADVASIALVMNPLDAAYPGICEYGPFSSPSGAIMSAPFMLMATLEDGRPKMTHFSALFHQGPWHEKSRMVRIEASDAIDRWTCRIALTTHDGVVHSLHMKRPTPFVYDWEETVALCKQVSAEWAGDASSQRFDDLMLAVSRLDAGNDRSALKSALLS